MLRIRDILTGLAASGQLVRLTIRGDESPYLCTIQHLGEDFVMVDTYDDKGVKWGEGVFALADVAKVWLFEVEHLARPHLERCLKLDMPTKDTQGAPKDGGPP